MGGAVSKAYTVHHSLSSLLIGRRGLLLSLSSKPIFTANPLMLIGTFTALAAVIDAGMSLGTIVSGSGIFFLPMR